MDRLKVYYVPSQGDPTLAWSCLGKGPLARGLFNHVLLGVHTPMAACCLVRLTLSRPGALPAATACFTSGPAHTYPGLARGELEGGWMEAKSAGPALKMLADGLSVVKLSLSNTQTPREVGGWEGSRVRLRSKEPFMALRPVPLLLGCSCAPSTAFHRVGRTGRSGGGRG